MTDHYLFDAEVSLRKYVCDTKFCDILECLVTGLVANLPPEPWDYLSDRLSELKSRKGAYSWNMFVEDDASLQKRIFPKGIQFVYTGLGICSYFQISVGSENP